MRNADFKPIRYQQFMESHQFRQRYWLRSLIGYPKITLALPNSTHHAINTLHYLYGTNVITQNVDSLHKKAGTDALELHGGLDRVKCQSCGAQSDRAEFQTILHGLNPFVAEVTAFNQQGSVDVASSNPDGDAEVTMNYELFNYPPCSHCGGILKPDVVFFGENMTAAQRDASFAQVDSADGLLVVGTSLAVYSAYRLVSRTKKPLAILNMGETRADSIASIKLENNSCEVMEKLETYL
jgi:NAD+-dependent protein deacetylase sirtuin 4